MYILQSAAAETAAGRAVDAPTGTDDRRVRVSPDDEARDGDRCTPGNVHSLRSARLGLVVARKLIGRHPAAAVSVVTPDRDSPNQFHTSGLCASVNFNQ